MTERKHVEPSFTIDKQYQNMIDRWYETHDPCARKQAWLEQLKVNPGALRGGCVGGDLKYIFTPTSIGMVLSVRCDCGAELVDVTDMENNW